jgi:hypothetical protein
MVATQKPAHPARSQRVACEDRGRSPPTTTRFCCAPRGKELGLQLLPTWGLGIDLTPGGHMSSTETRRWAGAESYMTRDGNGYPKPETRWVFTPLGYGFGSIFKPMGLLMGINLYPTGLWVRVCSYSTQTREPVGFLNPTKPSVYCHFIL